MSDLARQPGGGKSDRADAIDDERDRHYGEKCCDRYQVSPLTGSRACLAKSRISQGRRHRSAAAHRDGPRVG